LANTAADYKARNAGDQITILVVQDITANNSGSVASARNFSASSGISALPGKLKTSGVENLFSPTSTSSLTGKGQAATTSSMRTSLAGRVVAVLPSGTLVIEAERQLTMNNERQTLLLRGMVRPGDIGPNNAVSSNAIANLQLELKGKGVISEGNRPLNPVLRVILRILAF
jgi:flagellar L-ring protein precursor FlgH